MTDFYPGQAMIGRALWERPSCGTGYEMTGPYASRSDASHSINTSGVRHPTFVLTADQGMGARLGSELDAKLVRPRHLSDLVMSREDLRQSTLIPGSTSS